jgi:hypothetical protein
MLVVIHVLAHDDVGVGKVLECEDFNDAYEKAFKMAIDEGAEESQEEVRKAIEMDGYYDGGDFAVVIAETE